VRDKVLPRRPVYDLFSLSFIPSEKPTAEYVRGSVTQSNHIKNCGISPTKSVRKLHPGLQCEASFCVTQFRPTQPLPVATDNRRRAVLHTEPGEQSSTFLRHVQVLQTVFKFWRQSHCYFVARVKMYTRKRNGGIKWKHNEIRCGKTMQPGLLPHTR
jgi:hypothetical protein